MNPYRTCDLWCKKCLWHRCRCVQVGFDPAMLGCDRTVVWPLQYTQPPAQWYEIPELEVVDPPPEPQYTRSMTMDDLRHNAWEATIEALKERDA